MLKRKEGSLQLLLLETLIVFFTLKSMYSSQTASRSPSDVIYRKQCRICYNFVTVISLMSLKISYLNKKKIETVY